MPLLLVRFLFLALIGLVFHTAGIFLDFVGCAVIGILMHAGRQFRGIKGESWSSFLLPLPVIWWQLRQGFAFTEGAGWVFGAATLAMLLTINRSESDDPESIPDAMAVWSVGMSMIPWQAISLGQGMSFGWQAGVANLLLAERVSTRLSSGWIARRWLSILVAGFVLFYQQSLTGWFVRPVYAWLHLQYQISFILGGLFIWVTPGWKKHVSLLGWSAVPMVLAPILVRLQAGEVLFSDRFVFAALHPNLLASGYLLAFLALLTSWDQHSTGRLWTVAAMVILGFGVLLTQSRLQTVMLIIGVFHAFGLLKPSKYRVLLLVLLCLAGLYLVGIRLNIVPERFDYRYVSSERLYIWQAGIYRILNAPWGEGFLGFGYGLQPLPESGRNIIWDWFYPHTHNLFLEIFLALGIPMGIAAIGFLFYVMFRRAASNTGLVLLGSQLIIGLFEFVWYTPFHQLMLIVALADDDACNLPAELSPARRAAPLPLMVIACLAFALVGIQQTGAERAAVMQQIGWSHLSQGKAAEAADAMRLAGEIDARRLEYPLYEMLISWQLGERGSVQAATALRRLQRLMPDWDITWIAQGINQILQGNDQPANRIFLNLLNTPHPDVSGRRAALLALSHTGEARYESAGLAISRSHMLGELFEALAPILEPQIMQKAISNIIENSTSVRARLSVLIYGCEELGSSSAWLEMLPSRTDDFTPGQKDAYAAVVHHVGIDAGLGSSTLDPAAPVETCLTAVKLEARRCLASGDLQQARKYLAAWRTLYRSGNEGWPPVEIMRGEALLSEREGNVQNAFNLLSDVVRSAPEWMDARVDLCRVAESLGKHDFIKNLAEESLLILAQNWHKPTKMSWRSAEPRPTGDNWTVLLTDSMMYQFIQRHSPGFVPFAEIKNRWKAFWKQKTVAK